MVLLEEIAAFLDQTLKAEHGDDEPVGMLKPASALIHRIGLALEPRAGLAEWVRVNAIDALFIHRPWGLTPNTLPEATGLLAYHRSFDQWLTAADNPCLVQVFGLQKIQPLTWRDGEQIGVVGSIQPVTWQEFLRKITPVFDGFDEARPPAREPIQGVAFVGAMNSELDRKSVV